MTPTLLCTPEQVARVIREAMATQSHLRVAIDGRCASGKTTLAAYLQTTLNATVFHMDDFFLRPAQRTPERLAIPGENIDHERFLTEVLQPLVSGRSVTYRPYDCGSGTLGEPVSVVESPSLTVIEGSYSCHPDLRDFYHLRLFVTVDRREQLARICHRNGAEKAAVFRERWIPLEEAYFQSCGVEDICQYRVALS